MQNQDGITTENKTSLAALAHSLLSLICGGGDATPLPQLLCICACVFARSAQVSFNRR